MWRSLVVVIYIGLAPALVGTLGCSSENGSDPGDVSDSAADARASDVVDDTEVTYPGQESWLFPANTTGEQAVLGIVAHAPGVQHISESQALQILQEAATWYSEVSYGQLTLSPELGGTYEIEVHNGTHTDANLYAMVANSGIDLTKYDRFVVFVQGPDLDMNEATEPRTLEVQTAQGGVTLYAAFARVTNVNISTLLHEMGHGFGLADSGSLSSIDGLPFHYGNKSDVMGWSTGHFSAANKYYLGWIPEQQVIDVTATGMFTLTPLEQSMATVLRWYDQPFTDTVTQEPRTGHAYYYVETRRCVGRDQGLPFNTCDGVLISSVRVYDDPEDPWSTYTVDATPRTPLDASGDNALMQDATFSDTLNDVHITPLSSDVNGTLVYVHVGGSSTNHVPEILMVSATVHPTDPARLTLTVTASDPDGDELSTFWNLATPLGRPGEPYMFSAANTASGANVTHTFPDSTPRRVYLDVSDRRGGTASGYIDVFGYQAPELQVGTISIENHGEGRTHLAIAVTSDLPLSYLWTIDDGTTTTLPRPFHLFEQLGAHTVSVSISDGESVKKVEATVIVTLEGGRD